MSSWPGFPISRLSRQPGLASVFGIFDQPLQHWTSRRPGHRELSLRRLCGWPQAPGLSGGQGHPEMSQVELLGKHWELVTNESSKRIISSYPINSYNILQINIVNCDGTRKNDKARRFCHQTSSSHEIYWNIIKHPRGGSPIQSKRAGLWGIV